MEVRQADPVRDRDALEALWGEYLRWANDEFDRRWDFRMPVEEILQKNLADMRAFEPPAGRLLLAESEGRPVGVACLQRLRPDTAEIKRMYVREEARGTGLGRRLLSTLLDAARDEGYDTVLLDSSRFMHQAHVLYRSAGFEEIEEYPESEIPEELRQHWIFMRLDL